MMEHHSVHSASSYYWTVTFAATPGHTYIEITMTGWFNPHNCLFWVWDSVWHRNCTFCLKTIICGCFYGGFLENCTVASFDYPIMGLSSFSNSPTHTEHSEFACPAYSWDYIWFFSNWSKYFPSIPAHFPSTCLLMYVVLSIKALR